ncbi:MAG: hypothetical protein CVU05_14880 [Bacteroidetes bacterium HGW-Bacteroidetes-21]|jgi:hypothetical protein|nr:MAG: hypothetical protein CVU05_14880 [Bacteroidetes bacterium HGW-Bacteroidetes-21]
MKISASKNCAHFLMIGILAAGIILASQTQAQTDTIKKVTVSFKTNPFGTTDTISMDTMLIPSFFDPQGYFSRALGWNGNQGSPVFPLTFSVRQADQFEYTDFLQYFPSLSNNTFYNTRKPFSQVSFYTNGSKPLPEQGIHFLHTQNINPGWNIGLSGTFANSTGKYSHQENKNNNFRAFSHYSGKYYTGHISYNFGRFTFRENGGISDQTLYTDSLLPPENIPVNLSTASNIIKFRNLCTEHELTLLSFGPYNADSSKKMNRIILGGRFEFDRFRRLYKDTQDSSFYNNVWIDSLNTADSIQMSHYKTSLYLKVDMAKKFTVYAGGFFERRDNGMYEIHFRRDVVALNGGFALNPGKISLTADVNFHLTDEDQHIESKAQFTLPFKISGQNFNFITKAAYTSFDPRFYDTYYYSNHFFWLMPFTPITTASVEAAIVQAKNEGTLVFNMTRVTHPVYYGQKALPKQWDGSANYMSITGKYHLQMGHWNWVPLFIFQSQSDSVLQSLPSIITNQSIYYDKRILKVLDFTIGADVFYCSSFYGPAYMPATMTYYQQNEMLTGDYPVAGAFIGLKLKRARFLFKVHHINDKLTRRKNMLVAGYPLPDRYFSLGISWHFYN